MQKNILETRELTKVYREKKAVNAVSIQVRENTVYGLLGANGGRDFQSSRGKTAVRKFVGNERSKSNDCAPGKVRRRKRAREELTKEILTDYFPYFPGTYFCTKKKDERIN